MVFMTVTSPKQIKPWEIRIARVAFEESPNKAKVRPILVLTVKADADVVEALKITTNNKLQGFPIVEIVNWKELGLVKPSWLQLTPPFPVMISEISDPKVGDAPDWLKSVVVALYPDLANRTISEDTNH